MEWIKCTDRLPKKRTRCLARCSNPLLDEKERWIGIVDVCFDPNIGWFRCESSTSNYKLYVIEWMEFEGFSHDTSLPSP